MTSAPTPPAGSAAAEPGRLSAAIAASIERLAKLERMAANLPAEISAERTKLGQLFAEIGLEVRPARKRRATASTPRAAEKTTTPGSSGLSVTAERIRAHLAAQEEAGGGADSRRWRSREISAVHAGRGGGR